MRNLLNLELSFTFNNDTNTREKDNLISFIKLRKIKSYQIYNNNPILINLAKSYKIQYRLLELIINNLY